jgi:hypothetical protein
MPNWCTNTVTLSNDDPKVIDDFFTALKSSDCEPFQYLRPMPVEYQDDWYSWHVSNWGTKWDASIVDYEQVDKNTVWLAFDTAWSPPIELYNYLTEQGWNVDAQYQEEGMGFIGTYVDGEDVYYEYDISDRQSIEALPQEMIDYGDLLSRHEEWVEENEGENND